jgi:hypothetical protein
MQGVVEHNICATVPCKQLVFEKKECYRTRSVEREFWRRLEGISKGVIFDMPQKHKIVLAKWIVKRP